MLVALLSSQHTISGETSSEIGQARSAVRIGGQSVLSRQVDFALNAGCERIICLAQGLTPELVEIQHHVENAGAVFHAMRTAINLSGLVSMADDVLVMADGLVCDHTISAENIGPHRTILTLPADPAVNLGFERIDQDRAWAGMMVIAGALVEKLSELPDDVDTQSSLLRLALQSGTRCSALPAQTLSNQHWALVISVNTAEAYEHQWLAENTRTAPIYAPVHSVADFAARMTARKHPKASVAALSGNVVGMALLASGGAAGYFGYAAIALGLICIAAFAIRFAESLAFVLNRNAGEVRGKFASALKLFLDGMVIYLCIVLAPNFAQISTGFAVIILMGLLWMIQFTGGGSWWQKIQAIAEDRGLLAVALFAASFSSVFLSVLQGLTLIILAALLFHKFRAQLTPA